MASNIANSRDSQQNRQALDKAVEPFLDVLAEIIARDILDAETEKNETHENRDLRQKVHGR
jgi:hypothetical protein